MNAKSISLAIAFAALATSSAAFAQCVQTAGPATVTSSTIQINGSPTVTSSQLLQTAAPACAAPTTLMTRTWPAVLAEPGPKVLISRQPAWSIGLFKWGFGFGRVIRDWDNR